jgi:hypothetical protein
MAWAKLPWQHQDKKRAGTESWIALACPGVQPYGLSGNDFAAPIRRWKRLRTMEVSASRVAHFNTRFEVRERNVARTVGTGTTPLSTSIVLQNL